MSVNLPPVTTDRGDRTRILHIHQNVPGVLATVNGVLADFGVNIERQMLSTPGEPGYVVTDVAGPGRRPRQAARSARDGPAAHHPLARARWNRPRIQPCTAACLSLCTAA